MNAELSKLPNTKGKTDEMDKAVGNRLKARRILLGLSQQDLGDAVNVSIQQIQKYEKAMNRISCGKLYILSKLLKTPISYFFNNTKNVADSFALEEDQAHFAEEEVDLVSDKEAITLLRFYKGIKDESVRQKILDLVKTVAEKKTSI